MFDADIPILTAATQNPGNSIDHADARIFAGDRKSGAAPQELRHLLHLIDRTQHDADRAETCPTDTRFCEALQPALKSAVGAAD